MTVELRNVSKKYGNLAALTDVSITFEPGKIYGLIGENGSGKSTTLKLIAGLVKPDSGEVTVMNESVTRRIAKSVSYMTELDFFYPMYTVDEMLHYYESQFDDFNVEKAAKMLEMMKLDRTKRIQALSKGYRGRLRLVLALARDTPVVLLDEPFSGLDQLVREAVVESLLSFIDYEHQIVILTTHEIDEVETLLDEVAIIKNGSIIAKEPVEVIHSTQGKSIIEWMKSILRSGA